MKSPRLKATLLVLMLLFPAYAFAAGGGGGGSSSSGLGFGSRDSIYILVNAEYSQKFSLKNGSRYDLEINVEGSSADVGFGSLDFKLADGDNYLDLDDNALADINFRLESVSGKRANVRIIDMKDSFGMPGKSDVIGEEDIPEKTEDAKGQEESLKCGNLGSLRERVSCRLDSEEEDQEKELELYYFPEECRALSGSERGICIARYKSVQECWKFPIGDERVSCVKRSMKLGPIQEEKAACSNLPGEEKSACIMEIKNKSYNLIKWRFYDLEERAEEFMERGLADKESVILFIEKTEQNKAKFNEAKAKEERANTILAVRQDWKEFTDSIRDNLRG